jgi:hypothetical protein
MSVARGFVEAMGGAIAAGDTPGGGLTVVVDLAAPQSVGALTTRASDDAVGAPPACGGRSDEVGAPPACGGERR